MRPEVYGDTTPYYSTSIMLMHPHMVVPEGVYTPIYPPRGVYTGCITSLRYTPPAVSPRPRSTSPLLMSCSHGCRALYLYTRYNASTTCSHAFTCGLHPAHLYGCVYTLLGGPNEGYIPPYPGGYDPPETSCTTPYTGMHLCMHYVR